MPVDLRTNPRIQRRRVGTAWAFEWPFLWPCQGYRFTLLLKRVDLGHRAKRSALATSLARSILAAPTFFDNLFPQSLIPLPLLTLPLNICRFAQLALAGTYDARPVDLARPSSMSAMRTKDMLICGLIYEYPAIFLGVVPDSHVFSVEGPALKMPVLFFSITNFSFLESFCPFG